MLFRSLAAILISSSIGLFDWHSLRRYYRVSKPEFRHSVVAMLGVMTIGVLGGVVVAVGLAILRLLMLASKPHDAVLGTAPNGDGFVNLATEPSAKPISGVVIYRFDASLLFFNADYFASRVRQVIHDAGAKPVVLVLDAESMSLLDITGAEVLETLRAELDQDGIQLRIARSKGLFRKMLERSGVAGTIGRECLFPSIKAATDFSTQEGPTCNQ